MRQILMEWARQHRSQKRGVRDRDVEVDEFAATGTTDPDMILSLDESLTKLTAVDPKAAELVKLRLYAGLSVTEAGEALSLSRSRAYECWEFARVWFASGNFSENEE